MNKKKLAAFAAVAVIFGALGAVFGTKKDAAPLTTTMAPTGGKAHTASTNLYARTLDDLAGKPQAFSQWQGKPLLVNFWATWCAPCVQEMPELSAIADKEAGKRFNVIGVGIDSPTAMREFAAKHNIKYPLLVGGMGGTDIAREFGNANGGLPFTVLIGADGQVRKTYLGKLKFDELEADLEAL
ncbi:TlpA disulfide reductase family protein [Massilia sp. Leaf139]|uniref:TlpA family protein disulfide reductase n=1 Tax=Massilia sp. Leaf139 TaxID=1736272 RepID=UPI0006FB6453|nr:TlpA disulfide reductase family protein [Massilia sp. Leaf139]KQQ87452.1 alkyl hydroperoxide reductase [Massilia sp. Leaf139]